LSRPITFVGLSGSLRSGSTNTALLRAARELAPPDVEVVLEPIGQLPLFDLDLERAGPPIAVTQLRQAVTSADGLLLASPEYNHSTSAALKNAIDWLSRGPESPLDGLPTALLSAAGSSGGARAQAHLRDILRHNDVQVLEQHVQLARAWQHLGDGELVGQGPRDEVRSLVAALADHVRGADHVAI
jgi:chromate reductase, NAD(P)H dehydrogenase (quinone)